MLVTEAVVKGGSSRVEFVCCGCDYFSEAYLALQCDDLSDGFPRAGRAGVTTDRKPISGTPKPGSNTLWFGVWDTSSLPAGKYYQLCADILGYWNSSSFQQTADWNMSVYLTTAATEMDLPVLNEYSFMNLRLLGEFSWRHQLSFNSQLFI